MQVNETPRIFDAAITDSRAAKVLFAAPIMCLPPKEFLGSANTCPAPSPRVAPT